MGNKREKIIKGIKFIFPLFLLIFAIFEIRKFSADINGELLKSELNQLGTGELLAIFLITFAAVLPMILYDVILVKCLKSQVTKRELVEQSFIANSISNLIGFGGLIGAMLRTYFFHSPKYDNRKQISIIASLSLFYLTGISSLAWMVTIGFRNIPLFHDVKWLYYAVLGVSLYLPIFITLNIMNARKNKETLISKNATIQLVVVSIIEWFAVFIAIYFLSMILGVGIPLHKLFPVYVASACAGIISMIPGGLGSFDLVFIWGMQDLHMPEEKVLVLLLLYRLGYYFIPFIVGLVFFVKLYWKKWNQSWNNLPKAIVQSLSHIILTLLVFTSGLILLLSASVPGIMSRLRIAQELLAFPIINVSHQLTVAAGFLLLGLSRGIEYSVKRAYDITMLALILAALFSIFKGIDYEEAIFLIIVALLLRLSKGQFYRESYVLTWGRTIFDITIILLITSMYLVIGYGNLPSAKLTIPQQFLPYIIEDSQDLFTSAGIGLIIAFIILIAGYYISLPKKWKFEKSNHHEKEIIGHLNKYNGGSLAHLILLHDKYIFWNSRRTILIAFQQYADKLIILGEPIGEKKEISSAIAEFQELADLYGYTPVFYQVSDKMLPILHNHGFAFFKLGEEGSVDVQAFSLSGVKQKSLRTIQDKFIRDNYTYEIIKPPYTINLLKELLEISDDWLQGRREKGFSLGFFNEEYITKAPIAIVRNKEGKITGFVSIMYVYDNESLAVDLMRFRHDAPHGTIDFLLLGLIEWARTQGYKEFNMGMSPLANVGLSKFSFLSEKIAAQIYLHGHLIYHFQGLRNFKEKYTNRWEPKYLAYRKKSSLPLTMAQISLLISKKRQ
ncbi:bifunctional lysylphosphatidylglycerol flippase/synthetase MprF [Bacillus rubiinfantis]|uniref:bifunctional lysylphosphatidylglycerol flippase/synthetase MprF n=1 Tax=Bacillus rubiinfantis TaxID=1499680 RepID=UPI0005A8B931|nr:bifunctional lysylphosphatidylglycerol flippase/synthetase MprF [Bacillus rubiinfantis]